MSRSRRRNMPEGLELVERYARSGMSQRLFAESEGVRVSTLLYWLRKTRSPEATGAGTGGGRFVEVRRSAEGGASSMVWLELGRGMSVCFESPPSASYLVQVAMALSSVTRC